MKRGLEEEIVILNQLIKSLTEAELKLDEAYEKKDYNSFIKIKKIILQLQERIFEVVK